MQGSTSLGTGRIRRLSVVKVEDSDGTSQDKPTLRPGLSRSLSFSIPQSSWMTEEMLQTPQRHLRAHIKHVVCKRGFLLALLIASLAAATVATSNMHTVELLEDSPSDKIYTLFSTLVSFFIVIRTGHALSRLMEAATIVYSILGDWSDAVSSLLSFTRKATADEESVRNFQNMLVILVSMLNALCLAELEDSSDSQKSEAFDYSLINFTGFPLEALREVTQSARKVETVFQMIQALIVDNMDTGILNVPAPILTRSFQEMSQAMLKVHEANKLVQVPYPIDLNAASTFFLIIHTITSVWCLPQWLEGQLAIAAVFILVFCYWFVHGICAELEQPFSARATAIDMERVQDELNRRLQTFVTGARRGPLELKRDTRHVIESDDSRMRSGKSLRALEDYSEHGSPAAANKRVAASASQRVAASASERVISSISDGVRRSIGGALVRRSAREHSTTTNGESETEQFSERSDQHGSRLGSMVSFASEDGQDQVSVASEESEDKGYVLSVAARDARQDNTLHHQRVHGESEHASSPLQAQTEDARAKRCPNADATSASLDADLSARANFRCRL